jgi:hypothetical protein
VPAAPPPSIHAWHGQPPARPGQARRTPLPHLRMFPWASLASSSWEWKSRGKEQLAATPLRTCAHQARPAQANRRRGPVGQYGRGERSGGRATPPAKRFFVRSCADCNVRARHYQPARPPPRASWAAHRPASEPHAGGARAGAAAREQASQTKEGEGRLHAGAPARPVL